MKRVKILFAAVLCFFICFPAFTQENSDIELIFKKNKKILKKKAGVIQRFEPSWLNVDTN